MVKANSALVVIATFALIGMIAAATWAYNPQIFTNIANGFSGVPNPLQSPTTTTTTQAAPGGQCVAGPNAPLSLDLTTKINMDLNTGGNTGTKTDTFIWYDASDNGISEDDLDSSGGVITTGKAYRSGDIYNLDYNNTTTQQWFNGIKIPFECVDTASNHYITLETFAIGTFQVTVKVQGNSSTVATGGNYNITSTGSSTPTLVITLENTAANTGYLSSHNPITGEDLKPVFLIRTNGTGFNTISLKGQITQDGQTINPKYLESVTDRNWVFEIDPEKITRQVDSNGNVLKPGQTVINFQLDLTDYSVSTGDLYMAFAGYTNAQEVHDYNTLTHNDGQILTQYRLNILQ